MASAPWGKVCPLVAEKRSATQKCDQTLEGRGLIATKSRVSEKTLEIQICVEQLFLQVPPLSSILWHHEAPPVFPRVTETCKLSMSQGSRDRKWGRGGAEEDCVTFPPSQPEEPLHLVPSVLGRWHSGKRMILGP